MIKNSVLVESPGFLTTVQDLGRTGYGSFGVPSAGVMDKYSHRLANEMVGNSINDATIEMTFLGPTLIANGTLKLALVGGDLGAELNGFRLPSCFSFTLHKGDRLQFNGGKGVRAYLAVAGGWDVPKVLGSRSTYIRAALGGIDGKALQRDQVLKSLPASSTPTWQGSLPVDFWPELAKDKHSIRVLWGPQDDYFEDQEKKKFIEQTWKIGKDTDRMGYRLEGIPLIHRDKKEIISDGICPGAIQVPGHGQPIVLLADAQTTGGYPKIATVISADLGKLAHYRSSDSIRFQAVTYDEAVVALQNQEKRLQEALSWIEQKKEPTSRFFQVALRGQSFKVIVEEKS